MSNEAKVWMALIIAATWFVMWVHKEQIEWFHNNLTELETRIEAME